MTLVALLNIGGSPMSWAHAALPSQSPMSAAASVAPAMPEMEHCAEHETQKTQSSGVSHSSGGTPACCLHGACDCGCPATSFLLDAIPSPVRAVALADLIPGFYPPKPATAPPGSLLRPPNLIASH